MRRTFLAGVAVAAALAVPGKLSARNPWDANYFSNRPVVTQDGKTLRFYDDLIRGRIVVVSFVYTSCSDLCPIETARLAEVKDKLGDALGRDIFFVSLSVDPEHDTPEMLKAFADAFDTGPGWQFLTGQPEDIKSISAKFGDRSGDRKLGDHRNEVLIGNDATTRPAIGNALRPLKTSSNWSWRSASWTRNGVVSLTRQRAIRVIIGLAISRVRSCSRRCALPATRSAAVTMSGRICVGSPIAATVHGSSTSSGIRQRCWPARTQMPSRSRRDSRACACP